jgi:hypothetical protein
MSEYKVDILIRDVKMKKKILVDYSIALVEDYSIVRPFSLLLR